MNLNTQRKQCRLIVGVDGVKNGCVCHFLPKNFNIQHACDYFHELGLTYYIALHDEHDTDSSGKPKHKHYHVVLTSTKILRFSQYITYVAEAFQCSTENVQALDLVSIPQAVQYLIHKNEDEKIKYHYSSDIIKTNDSDIESVLNADIHDSIKLDTKQLICLIDKCKNPLQLMLKIGIGNYNCYKASIESLFAFKDYHPQEWQNYIENGVL